MNSTLQIGKKGTEAFKSINLMPPSSLVGLKPRAFANGSEIYPSHGMLA